MSTVDRINQLEAPQIDEECQAMLQEQVLQGLELWDSSLVARLKPEISFFVNCVYFRYTVWKNAPLPGHNIQNIQYSNGKENGILKVLTKKQKVLYFLLDVVGRYLYEKLKLWLDDYEINEEEGHKKYIKLLKKVMDVGEKVYKFLDLINFLSFLVTFKYRNLIERVLKIQYSYVREKYSRFLDFELMTRTVIWNVLADFMAFFLPYLRYGFGEMAKRFFFFTTFMGSISMDLEDSDKKCGICLDENVSMPFMITRCQHRFCYFCIKNYMNEHKTQSGEQNLKCPKCRVAFTEIEGCHKKERKTSGVF